MEQPTAEIGVFGGSGFYQLLENVEEKAINTPYGAPSDKIALGEVAGRKVAFLPRHGRGHKYPAHAINYRANLWAMKSLGVKRIIAPASVGSLQPHIKPGDFVICDQFVDRTSGRKDTFYDGPVSIHISTADPYCPELRELALSAAKDIDVQVHPKGTVVVIQGPRFSTRAESRWFASAGWDVINMTQHPEATLARELEICYVNISLVTDYDVGLEGTEIEPVSVDEIIRVFNENNRKVRDLIFKLIPMIPSEANCSCQSALKGAVIS